MTPKIGIDRGYRLTVRIPAGLARELRDAAKAQGETVTAMVERAIRTELERVKRAGD